MPNEKVDRLGEFTIQRIVSKHSLTAASQAYSKTMNAFTILHSYVNRSRYSNEKCLNNDSGDTREIIQEERLRDLMGFNNRDRLTHNGIVIIYWR